MSKLAVKLKCSSSNCGKEWEHVLFDESTHICPDCGSESNERKNEHVYEV